MAGRDYAAEYARRVASGAKKGKTRQQARGHKPREHVARRARETKRAAETGALTSSQKQTIKKFLREQAYRFPTDFDDLWDDYRDHFFSRSWEWFKEVRAERNALVKEGRGAMGNSMTRLERHAKQMKAEGWMLFYH